MANPYLTIGPICREDLGRLFSQITITSEVQFQGVPCWIWTGHIDENGYGRPRFHGPKLRVHRLMFAWLVHPLPINQEETLDHLCRRTACCNPVHLEFVSKSENSRRMNAAKTHCKHGHPLSGDNIRINKRNTRLCLTCRRIANDKNKKRLPNQCKNGHLRTPENLYVSPDGERVCRPCSRMRVTQFAERNPERYRELQTNASATYDARHPERRREAWRQSNRKRALAKKSSIVSQY